MPALSTLRLQARRISHQAVILPLAALLGTCLAACSTNQGHPGAQVNQAARPYPTSDTTAYLPSHRPQPIPQLAAAAHATPQAAAYATPQPQPRPIPAAATVSTPIYPQGVSMGNAQALMLIDAQSGQPLLWKNPDQRRGAASTQKLLTALLVVEAGNLDKRITIAASDTNVVPTKLNLKPGDTYTRRQLLEAILVRSANDASMALARDNAGSAAAFAQKMNQRARQLGAQNSSFANPHGLTAPGQYSTARDIAIISFHAHRHPTIREIVRKPSYSFRFANGSSTRLENTNKLLTRMPECNGMKTGFTNAAGRCLVSTATSGGREVILVQLGTQTKFIWDDGAYLMRWGLARANGTRPPALAQARP